MEPVQFTESIQTKLEVLLSEVKFSALGVIADSNTMEHCYDLIKETLPDEHSVFSFKAGEINKNLATCTSIWKWMTAQGFDRKALILNLGGGVTGDMGGFCAATYKRGIRFIQIPTSLLAQVDASVGGKLGIDFMGFKNHIGVFTQPETVLIDKQFLKTLPQNELRSGYAEILKHGLIRDKAYFNSLKKENWQKQDWGELIKRSVAIKKAVVEADPLESGLRKILNFGHTIGHAVESHLLDTRRHVLHGEAIAVGMICEGYLSTQIAGLKAQELDIFTSTLHAIYDKVSLEVSEIPALIERCFHDKKNEDKQVNFSLLEGLGVCGYNYTADADMIRKSLIYYINS